MQTTVSLLLAGYETTSTAVAFLLYDLVTHQGAQEALYREIRQHFPQVRARV